MSTAREVLDQIALGLIASKVFCCGEPPVDVIDIPFIDDCILILRSSASRVGVLAC